MLYFIFSLVLNSTFAQESPPIYLSPCFPSQEIANFAKHKLKFIKLESDKIENDANCLNILTSSKRELLFTNFLQKNFQNIAFKTVKPKMCSLELIKTSINLTQSSKHQLKKKITLMQIDEQSKSRSSNMLVVNSGATTTQSIHTTYLVSINKDIQVITEEKNISINCSVVNNGLQLVIDFDSNNEKISTNVFLRNGEELDLGNIDTNTYDKDSSIGINGIRYSKNNILKISSFKIRAR